MSAVDFDEIKSGFLASTSPSDHSLQQARPHVPLDSIEVCLLELLDVLRSRRDGVRVLAGLERDLRGANDCPSPLAHTIVTAVPTKLGSPLFGHPPACSDGTEPPSHPSSWAILSTHGASVEAFRPAWASWIPILPRWAWTKSTMRLNPAMCESSQMPWGCQRDAGPRGGLAKRGCGGWGMLRCADFGEHHVKRSTHAVLRRDTSLGHDSSGLHHNQTPAPHGHAPEVHKVMIRRMPVVRRVCAIPDEHPNTKIPTRMSDAAHTGTWERPKPCYGKSVRGW
jgi:hypothetical protein